MGGGGGGGYTLVIMGSSFYKGNKRDSGETGGDAGAEVRS